MELLHWNHHRHYALPYPVPHCVSVTMTTLHEAFSVQSYIISSLSFYILISLNPITEFYLILICVHKYWIP